MTYQTPDLSRFSVIRSQGWLVYVHPDFPEELAQWTLASMRDTHAHGLKSVAASRFARVFHGMATVKTQAYPVYVKHYLHRSLIDLGKHLLRPGRAMRALRAAVLLNDCDLHCPVVMSTAFYKPSLLGWPLIQRLPLCLQSVAVTLAIENSAPLHSSLGQLDSRRTKRMFLRTLGHEIGRMHGQGVFHGDLRTGNILVQAQENGWRFWFLDNERTRRFKVIPRYLVVRNLVQLHLYIPGLTNTDRACFFKAYQEHVQQSRPDQHRLVHQVWKKTRRRVRSRLKRTALSDAQATWV
jgi:tRNA A-37 threonylcarbamoyl transferase component Bud32